MFSFAKLLTVAVFTCMSPALYAELESINDGELANVTGQGGLTIDYSGRMSLQQFLFVDSGEYVVEDIRTGGAGMTVAGRAAGYDQNFDDARLTFDIASDGGLDLLWQSQSGSAMDWGFAAGSVGFGAGGSATRAQLFSGLQVWGFLRTAQHSVLPSTVSGLGRSASYNYAAFTIENLSAAKSDSTVGIDGGYVRSPNFMGNSVDDMNLSGEIPAWAGGQRARSTTPMDDLRAGFAAVEFTVYPVSAAEQNTPYDTISVGLSGLAADVGAQNLSVGQADLGGMTLDNLRISDTIITLTP